MKTAEEHYNQLAEVYDKKWKEYNNKTAEEIIKNLDLKENLKILDAGCGTGILIEKLLKLNPNVIVLGVDISKEMLIRAKQRLIGYKNVKLLKKDIENLELREKFDLIISNSSIHYLDNLDKVIINFKSLLNENGELILVDWCMDSILFKILNFYWKLRINGFKRIYTVKQIKEILDRNGFLIKGAYTFKVGSWYLYFIKAKVIK